MNNKRKSAEPRNMRGGKLRKINEHAAGIDIGSREHYVAVADGA